MQRPGELGTDKQDSMQPKINEWTNSNNKKKSFFTELEQIIWNVYGNTKGAK